MEETIIKETVEGTPGAVEPPAQPVSEPKTEPSAVDVDSLKGILEPMVQDAFERQQQSLKDKRFAKQESRISGLEDTLTQLKALKDEGLSEKIAIEFLEMREQLGGQSLEVPAEVPPANVPAEQTPVAVEDYLSPILKLAGLDSNDAGVIEIIKSNLDPIAKVTAVSQLAESRKQTTPAVPGAVMASGGGGTVESDDIGSLSTRLAELTSLPMQTAESEAERAEIRAKLNQLQPIQKTIV